MIQVDEAQGNAGVIAVGVRDPWRPLRVPGDSQMHTAY